MDSVARAASHTQGHASLNWLASFRSHHNSSACRLGADFLQWQFDVAAVAELVTEETIMDDFGDDSGDEALLIDEGAAIARNSSRFDVSSDSSTDTRVVAQGGLVSSNQRHQV